MSGTATFTPALPSIKSTTKVLSTLAVKNAKLGGCVGGGVTSGRLSLTAKFSTPENCATLAATKGGLSAKATETLTFNSASQTNAVRPHFIIIIIIIIILVLIPIAAGGPTVTIKGKMTGGPFAGLTESAKIHGTFPAGACTKTPLAKSTFKQVTPLIIK